MKREEKREKMWRFNPPMNHHSIHHHNPLTRPIGHLYATSPGPTTQAHLSHSDYERKLIEEVLYLHSLWQRGPPSSSSHNPATPHLKPTHTTHFKKSRQSDKQWPIDDPKPTSDGLGWPAFKPNNQAVSRPATGAERDRHFGVKIQLKGLDSCASLFQRNHNDEDEEDEEEDDGDDEVEVELFENLFEGDKELRGFYENNFQNGDFFCLVCGVIGKKLGRKYKSCVALVQHSVTISKTKKKKTHRAYGKVVCKILGWDIDRLPSLPLLVAHGEGSSGQLLSKACEVQLERVKTIVTANWRERLFQMMEL